MPFVGGLFGVANAPDGVGLPESYNQLGAMHRTIMVFLRVVPLADLAPGHGQALWLGGMGLIIFSSLLGAINIIATIIQRPHS